MMIEKINKIGRPYTWANNRQGEGFLEEKLDRFFGAASWMIKNPRAKVIQVEKQSSDHSLLVLVAEPEIVKFKRRFYFDQTWLQWGDINEVVDRAWNREQVGTFMSKVCSRIKACRVDLLKWSKKGNYKL